MPKTHADGYLAGLQRCAALVAMWKDWPSTASEDSPVSTVVNHLVSAIQSEIATAQELVAQQPADVNEQMQVVIQGTYQQIENLFGAKAGQMKQQSVPVADLGSVGHGS